MLTYKNQKAKPWLVAFIAIFWILVRAFPYVWDARTCYGRRRVL